MINVYRIDLRARLVLALALLVVSAAVAVRTASAQPASEEATQILPAAELEELVGPIALYPDDLVGIALPASTFPLQVVEAARFLERRAQNPSLEPDPDWDDSVVALLNYPAVVELMNDDLDWTWRLGEAVLNQRSDVLDAIQRFRSRARAAGNLRTDEREVVTEDEGVIAIKPADPEVIYVPYYEPKRVVVHQPVPVYHYHPVPYPVYYYPYPAGYVFHSGFFWGVTSAFTISWHTHLLHVHHHSHFAHPYHGRRYYDPYYYRRNVYINVIVDRDRYVWQPHYRHPGRPFARSDARRAIAGVPATHTREGYQTRRREAITRPGVIREGRASGAPRVTGRDGDDRTHRGGTYRSGTYSSGGASRSTERPSTAMRGERSNPGTARAAPQRVQPQSMQPPRSPSLSPRAPATTQPKAQTRTERYRSPQGATAERYRVPGAAAERSGGPRSSAERYRAPDSTALQRYGGASRSAAPERNGAPGGVARSVIPRANANAPRAPGAATRGQSAPPRGERGHSSR